MRYRSIVLIAVVLIATAVGCKWNFGSESGASNNSNANNSNRSSANANTNTDDEDTSSSPTPDPDRDMSPTTMTVSEMVEGSGDKDMVGRMVTVSDGVLENIDSDKLRIRGAYGGAAFYCNGEFSDYMKMADRVRELSQSGRSPKVTVKGLYDIATVGSGGELSPCVLTDIEKP